MLATIISGVMVCSAVYVYKTYISNPPPLVKKITENFKTVGVVKQILIYPLDGGPVRELDLAYCTQTGLHGDDFNDRSFVVYSRTNKEAILNVGFPELISLKNLKTPFASILHSEQSNKSSQREVVNINYLGRAMTVEDLGDKVAQIAEKVLEKTGEEIRVGFCSPENREKCNDYRIVNADQKPTEVVDEHSPYFANYTLINSNSLQHLEQETGVSIYPEDFRANVVIEGAEFCEDNLFSLKIGNVLFYDVHPCTHAPSAFICQTDVENPEDLQPYQYLKQNRSQSVVHPEFGQLKFPIFGVNMTLVSSNEDNIIRVGDPVEATNYYFEKP